MILFMFAALLIFLWLYMKRFHPYFFTGAVFHWK